MNEADIICKVHKSMIFNIPRSLRFLSCKVEKNRLYSLAYFRKEPMDYEKNCIFSIFGETCGHFPHLESGGIEILVSTDDFENLKHYKHLVFAAYEAEKT